METYLLLLALIAVAVISGWSRLPAWMLLIVPALLIAIGYSGTANEPSDYDMPGFAQAIFTFLALCVLVLSAVCRGARLLAARHRRRGVV